MGWLQVTMLVYGIFDIVMGFLGYSHSGSIVSFIAGGVSGILVIGCAALTKTNPRVGFIAATVIALGVAAMMAKKTFSGVVYPSGIIFGVSLAFSLILLGAHFAAVSKRKSEAANGGPAG
jgi:uncharacterized membrane protein (UPF0136 family)